MSDQIITKVCVNCGEEGHTWVEHWPLMKILDKPQADGGKDGTL